MSWHIEAAGIKQAVKNKVTLDKTIPKGVQNAIVACIDELPDVEQKHVYVRSTGHVDVNAQAPVMMRHGNGRCEIVVVLVDAS